MTSSHDRHRSDALTAKSSSSALPNLMCQSSAKAGIVAQVADFCREWWTETGDQRDPALLDDPIVVRSYFEKQHDEYLSVDSVELAAPGLDGAPLEFGVTLVASTRHIAPATAGLLDQLSSRLPYDQPLGVADMGFGWFVSVPVLDDVHREDITPELAAIIDFARSKGARFLLLDSDGPEIEGLDRHDW